MKRIQVLAIAAVLLCALLTLAHANQNKPPHAALFTFVNKPDKHYSWSLVGTQTAATHTTYAVKMTSQKYLTEQEVDRPIWEHDLLCVVPNEIHVRNRALLVSLGGNNGAPVDATYSQIVAGYALASHSSVCALFNSLNQPLRFAIPANIDTDTDTDSAGQSGGDTEWTAPIVEDAIIAHLWNRYMDTGNSDYVVRFAMVKSIVRAMDTVQALFKKERSARDVPRTFILAGGSKHGWSTHLAAAADQRVSAIVPIVIDIADTKAVMERTHASLCKWPIAMSDYVAAGIISRINTPEFTSLAKLEDPLSYVKFTRQVRMFHHSATSDQFFITDAATLYFDKLSGTEKGIQYHPNEGHGFLDFLSVYTVFLHDKKLPRLSWALTKKSDTEFQLTAETYAADQQPLQVKLWQADSNGSSRDFSHPIPGIPGQDPAPVWTGSAESVTREEEKKNGRIQYSATVELASNTGFKGLLLEFTYTNPVNGQLPPLVLTTTAFVVPDVLPCA